MHSTVYRVFLRAQLACCQWADFVWVLLLLLLQWAEATGDAEAPGQPEGQPGGPDAEPGGSQGRSQADTMPAAKTEQQQLKQPTQRTHQQQQQQQHPRAQKRKFGQAAPQLLGGGQKR
jgi:hypothetical protein